MIYNDKDLLPDSISCFVRSD